MPYVLLLQAGGAAIAAIFMFFISGNAAGYSAMLGGVSVVLPSAAFAGALRLMQGRMNWSSPTTLMALEATKFLIAAILLSWIFTSVRWLEAWAFFLGVIASLFAVILLAFARERQSTSMTLHE